jgi:5'-nucleotidase
MSAAMEASIEGIPSIGFSLLDYRYEADFEPAKFYVRKMVLELLQRKKLDPHFLLNVNIPNVPLKEIKGIKICKQAYAKYDEEFDERIDPQGKKYFWLTGVFKNFDKGKDTDVWALQNNYVSAVPIQFDLTNYQLKKQFDKEKWFK